MTVAIFEPLVATQELQDAGCELKLANAIVGVVDRVVRSIPTDIATKSDLSDLKAELKEDIAGLRVDNANLKTELKEDIAGLRVELREDIAGLRVDNANLRAELKSDIASVKIEIIKWMAGIGTLLVAFSKLIDYL